MFDQVEPVVPKLLLATDPLLGHLLKLFCPLDHIFWRIGGGNASRPEAQVFCLGV